MGFQVTPYALASPNREIKQLHMIFPQDGREGKKILPCAANNDVHIAEDGCHGSLINQLPCTFSIINQRSQSANLFLSQCSSLASIPSLGLEHSNDDIWNNLHHLGADARTMGIISGHYSCLTTLRSLGDQVASTGSPSDRFVFSASSSSSAAPSLKAWLKLGVAESAHCTEGFGSKREGAVRSILVVGDRVFTAHDDMKVRVWARPGISAPKKEINSTIRASPGSGSPGAKNKLVATLPTMWDCVARSMVPGAYLQVRRHHKKLWIQHSDAISALAVDSKQEYLYTASWDRSVKVWRMQDFRCVESFRAHDDAINTLAFSADGFLYTAAADGKIKVWARQTSPPKRHRRHSLVATLEAHRSAVNALALSTDGTLLFSGACDKAIVVWERENSAQHASLAGALRGHRQAVLCLASLGETLCSGSADKSIRVWQRVAGRVHACVAVLQGHAAPVKSLIFLPEGAGTGDAAASECLSLCSAAFDHDIKLWQLRLSFS